MANNNDTPVMSARIDEQANKLIVEVPLQAPTPSGSGNSKLIAKGNVKIPFGGKTATIQVNGFIPMKQYL